MKMKLRWSYALYLIAVLSVFLLNIFVFGNSNILKLSINTLFATMIGFFVYPVNIKDGNWGGFTKGMTIFVIAYPLLWYLLGQFSYKDGTRIFSLFCASAICFRPPDHSWQSALKLVGWLFGLTGIYYLADTIFDHFL